MLEARGCTFKDGSFWYFPARVLSMVVLPVQINSHLMYAAEKADNVL